MMRILVRIFALVGLLTVLLIAGAVTFAMVYGPKAPKLPEAVVLEFDFEQPLAEAVPQDPLAGLFGEEPSSLRAVVEALDRAARDPRVKGLVARVGNSAQGLGATQELRDAIDRFRASGRFAIVHAQSFGEFSNGTQSYYLASAFGDVWLQPGGLVGITGLLAQPTTYRGTLDKIGVRPMIEKRNEYKTFAETFMEREITPAHREMLESVVGDLYGQVVAGIAAGRGLPVDAVEAAIDAAPLLDREAVERKLVNQIGWYDEAVDAALELAGPESDMVGLLAYAKAAAPAVDPAAAKLPVVAVITGEGGISRGEAEPDPFSNDPVFAADTVASHFRDAIDDPSVQAILFRVDSPGGSAIGSDVVLREVERARAAGKKVVVSMSDLAASGGYWVSMAADRIVAQPATLTGSIGVVAGKLDISGATDMLGIGVDAVGRGRNAGIWSMQQGYSDSERARLDAMLDDIYTRFTTLVAQGRNMPLEKVQEIARGRVWTGRQALDLGLVDALGGYATAIGQIRVLLDLPEDARLALVPFPKPKSQFQLLMEMFDSNGGAVGTLLLRQALAEHRTALEPLAPLLRAATRPEEQVLAMPALGLAGY